MPCPRALRCMTLALVVTALVACAAPVPVRPTRLQPLAGAVEEFQVAQDTPIKLATGYARLLPAGSRWRAVGLLPEGVVYQPTNSVFSIEGQQVHEACLVVRDGALQGFFLPAESNFSPLSPTLPLPKGVQR